MAADGLREIHLGVPGGWILKLRVAGLPPEGGEAAHGLRVQAARDVGCGGQSLDAEKLLQTGPAQIGRLLACEHVREAEADLENRRRRDGPGIAPAGVLLDGVNEAVAVA